MIMHLLMAAAGAVAPAPADTAYIRCAFEKAGELAVSTSDSAEAVAEQVVAACARSVEEGGAPPATEATRLSIRSAAIAMVNRKRGTDGQPADAPLRVSTVEREEAVGRLDIPDEIAPAIVPYVLCVNASAGVPVYTEGRKALVPPPPGITKGSDCNAIRRKAAKDADKMLKESTRMRAADRQAFIERVLTQVGDFFRSATRSTHSQ